MTEPHSTGRRGAGHRLPFDFDRLMDPVGADAFRTGYWERRHLVLHRGDPGFYADLLTLRDMDELISTSRVRSSDLRVIADGRDTPISELVSDDRGSYANAVEKLYGHYRNGATINLLFLHEQWTPLRRLCHSLSDVLSAMFHVNAYLTPAAARGLAEHYDTHDVFVAQVYGSKRWRLYAPPVRLPLKEQRYLRGEHGPGEPVAEFDLAAGDLLYLPRGTVHQAVSNDTASLHLTIGVQAVLWADVLRAAVERATGAEVRFREALPMGFARDAELLEQAEQRAGELLDLLRAAVQPGAVVAEARTRALHARRSSLDGHLLDLEALPSVDLDTKLARRPEMPWRLVEHGSRCGLEFHGKEVRLPGHAAEAVRFAAEAAILTGREIPGALDEPGRLVLVRTLVREGFLTMAAGRDGHG